MAVWLGGVNGLVRRPLVTTVQSVLAAGNAAACGEVEGLQLGAGAGGKEIKSHFSMEGLLIKSVC